MNTTPGSRKTWFLLTFLIVVFVFCLIYLSHINKTKNASLGASALGALQQATTDPTTWKGVNLPLKLHAKPGYPTLTQADFDRAAALGANVIRLNMHADPAETLMYSTFVDSNGNVIPAATSPGMADIKQAVAMAAKDHLKVILDFHTSPGTLNGDIWGNQADWVTLQKLWAMIAINYKNNPTVVAFDLMNEPTLLKGLTSEGVDIKPIYQAMVNGTWTMPVSWTKTPKDYNFQMTYIINTIRSFDPNRTIVIEGFGQVGQPVNFTWMKPITGFNNIVYSFHMYIPQTLTDITRPDDPNPAPFKYPADESQITNAFAPVLAFQQKYNVPIWVGEFGIEDPAIFQIDPTTKLPYNGACWVSSVMKAMDANHWGWTLWDLWTPGRIPVSAKDPRYVALTSDMKQGIVPDYCVNLPVLDSTPSPLPLPPDSTPPSLTLTGGDITLTVGDTFTDPGAIATDDTDGSITPVVTGSVDTTTAGTYTLTYTATDKAGNKTIKTRTVTVTQKAQDITPPSITLSGGDMTLTVGDTFTDPGATAVDDTDGPLTPVVTGSVNTTSVGTYTLTYTATDKAGNTSHVTRTVVVNQPIVVSGGGGGCNNCTTPVVGDGGTPSGGGIISSPSGVLVTVSQSPDQPVSNTIEFHAVQTSAVTIPVTPPTVKPATPVTKPTTKKPTTPVTKPVTPPTQPVTPPSEPTTPSVPQTPQPSVTSIDYTLNDKPIHTTTIFPDTWNLDTRTLPNDAYTLKSTYHYSDGSSNYTITIFVVRNGQTIIQSIWSSVTGFFSNLFSKIF